MEEAAPFVRPALWTAASLGQPEKVKQLLADGASDVEEKGGRDGSTPLHQAVILFDTEMVRTLLEHGAKPSAKSNDGDTPLHLATSFEHVWDVHDGKHSDKLEVVRLLIQYGAKPSVQNNRGETPLHFAVMHLEGHVEVVRLFLDAGADASVKTNNGDAPIVTAMQELAMTLTAGGWESWDSDEVFQVIGLLLNHGADVSATSKYGETSLHFAAVCGDEPLVRLLLQRGGGVSSKDNAGRTPLHSAVAQDKDDAFAGQYKAVQLLLNTGADMSDQDAEGNTPLHVSARHSDPDMIRLLLEQGAGLSVQNTDGNTPLEISTDEEVLALLTAAERCAKCTALAMGHHPRLGGVSLLMELPRELLQMVQVQI
jgi:ankyrin repeat protein